MVQRVSTVAFEGIEARAVDVQVQVAPGLPAFNVVGLPDKAVSEARERVRSALIASGLALPARRITVNLAPADIPKEGKCRFRDESMNYAYLQYVRRRCSFHRIVLAST
jgi:magnesium chelatase family protein